MQPGNSVVKASVGSDINFTVGGKDLITFSSTGHILVRGIPVAKDEEIVDALREFIRWVYEDGDFGKMVKRMAKAGAILRTAAELPKIMSFDRLSDSSKEYILWMSEDAKDLIGIEDKRV